MDRFNQEIQRVKEDIRYQPIKVLVWGPGQPGSDSDEERKRGYRKREQIRQEVSTTFPRTEVYFSEELMPIDLANGRPLLREAVHARISDLIIILDLGRGVDLELGHFIPGYPWFRDKAFLLIKEEYVGTNGLVGEIHDYLPSNQIRRFSEEEFNNCEVATKLAIEATEVACLEYLLSH